MSKGVNRFCFLAIVRDEAPTIERCLESVKNIATSYLICDTGSKDDTVQRILNFTERNNIPGEVIFREWVSYGDNKSELLRVFNNHPLVGDAKYICWLDADEVFIVDAKKPDSYPNRENSNKLYEYLESRTENVFYIKTLHGDLIYSRWQIARNNQLYQWKLPYQEYFVGTVSNVPHHLPSDKIPLWNLSRRQGNSSRDPDITKKRIAMAEKWMEKNPADPDMARMIFYLAEAYIGVNKEKAIELYKKRLEHVGYIQERYISLLKLAELESGWESKVVYWMAAQDLVPNRLEAFYDMMIWYYNRNEHRRAVSVFYSAPFSRVPPADAMFIRQSIYDWMFDLNASVSMYLIGEYQKAYEVGSALLARKTCNPAETELAEKNLKFFKEKYKPGVSGHRIDPSSPLPSVIIIDNFYENPLEVRERALKMDYPVRGNYPGFRTESTATEADKLRFESILGRSINYWPTTYNGSFQYTTKENKSWIHRDPTNFSAVIYLTPDAPANGGTVLYRHKATGLERSIEKTPEDIQLNNDGNDETKWEVIDRIGNKFNRAIIFQGGVSHKSDTYFGDDIHNGRLFQTFFFNVDGRKY